MSNKYKQNMNKMGTPTVCLNPQKSPFKASVKNTSDDSYAASQLEQIKNTILQPFKYEDGRLSYRHQLWYKDEALQLVQHLVERYKKIEQFMQNSRTNPGIFSPTQLQNKNYKQQFDTLLKKSEQELKAKESTIKQLQQKIRQYRLQLQAAQRNAQKQRQKQNELEKKHRQLKMKLEQISKALDSAKKISKNITSSFNQERNIFLGQILVEEPDYRQFLTNVIQGFMGRVIKYSKHLYSMDMLNPTNFHKYFDNKPNLLLVVVLKNGYTLAAFSEQAISEKMTLQKKGLIISLTNRRFFRSYKKAVCYDKFHIIFGNNELRILNGKDKIYSNLGVNNGYYENKDHYRVDTLLGEGNNRQATMQSYQLLQIQFK